MLSNCLSFGKLILAKSAIVAIKSITVADWWEMVPDGIVPGHQAIPGSCKPPSNVVSFPHKNGPFNPPVTKYQKRYSWYYEIRIYVFLSNKNNC